MIEAIDKRNEEIGRMLLDEIIIDLTNHKVDIDRELLEKLIKNYMSIDNKINMRCKYEEFLTQCPTEFVVKYKIGDADWETE